MSSLFANKSTSLSREQKITDDEFVQLRDFIYKESGIYIAENRKYLIENRLSTRIRDLNLKNFGEYYYYLRFDPRCKDELTKLFESITTNETSFYRNPPQLKVFQDIILAKVLERLRREKSRKLRIWSAGCSTGEEPYTLSIMLHEVLKTEIPSWDIKITAMDLSAAVLASARNGVYSDYALRTTPKEIVDKYFINKGSQYAVKPELKKIIQFIPGNLSDRFGLKKVERSQILFCRNVIIYFDDEMKKQVIASFYDNLLPGGYMFIGHSESLHNISRSFKPEHHPGAIVYVKEEAGTAASSSVGAAASGAVPAFGARPAAAPAPSFGTTPRPAFGTGGGAGIGSPARTAAAAPGPAGSSARPAGTVGTPPGQTPSFLKR